ncbi:MAG: hypothetical protein R2788_17650 [Saprospiraceae bacterium]
MNFRQLLDLAQNSKGGFVEISDGQYLSITSQLRRKLDDLNAVISKTKNDMRFPPLAAPMLGRFHRPHSRPPSGCGLEKPTHPPQGGQRA